MTPERWRKIESIFQTVVEKPKPERQQMLTQYCGNDTELRREVEALLSEDDTNDFDDFIQAPIKDVARSLPQPGTDNYIGKNIGPYHVVKLLGQGGMGAVYLAERADAEFYRQVALKIVRRGMDSNFVLKRFRMERQILATLEHPNIAQLLDGGTTADGLPYFVMEYVQGRPLTEYCGSGGISLTERLKLFLSVCAAVQYAHQKLIIHRDLKPSNILVTADGVPKLLDFGIAKLLDPALSLTPVTRTQTSMRLMTPDYASPEQVRGLPVTTASDVYTLGVILFELLTGARPYQFETYSPAEIERAICDTEIERPSALAERMNDEDGGMKLVARFFHHSSFIPHRSSLRGDLDNIVLMALRKEPERRYQSVEQFAEDIRCYLQGRPISARRESALYRTGKFVRRNKLAVAAATLVFFSLLGGIVTTTRAARIAETERARAEANLAEAQTQRAEADRQRLIAEEQRMRAETEAVEANLQRQIAEAQHAEADAQRRNAETQQERAERRFAQVRKLANTFLFDFHDKIAALPGSTEAREMVVKTALEYLDSLAKEAEGDVSLQSELAAAYQRIGDVQGYPSQANLGHLDAALKSYRRSIELSEKLRLNQKSEVELLRRLAETYARVGEVARRLNKREDAREAYQKAQAFAEQLLATDAKDERAYYTTIQVSSGLGDLENLNGNLGNFLKYRHQAVAAVERLHKEIPSERSRHALASEYLKSGYALLKSGALDEAWKINQRALEIETELLNQATGNLAYRRTLSSIHSNQGEVERARNNISAAVEHYKQALAINEQMAVQDPKDALARYSVRFQAAALGDALLENNDPQQALLSLRKALDRGPEAAPLPPEVRIYQIFIYLNLAQAQWKTGDREGAKQSLSESRSILKSMPVNRIYASGVNAHSAQIRMGKLMLDLGDDDQALSYLTQALDSIRAQIAAKPSSINLRRDLPGCYDALGKYHATLAARSRLSHELQLVHWREARHWYQQNLMALRELVKQLPGDIQSARYLEEVSQKIARCDAALAELAVTQKR